MRTLAIVLALISASLSAAEPAKDKGTAMNFDPKVSITPADCLARGLPPIAMRFDLTGAALMNHLFPAADQIAQMGGPPGGPSSFSIEIVRAPAGKPLPTLEALVTERNRGNAAFKLGREFELEINGGRTTALYWESKIGPWGDNHAAALFPLPNHNCALYIAYSAYEKDGKIIPGNGGQAEVLKTLKWEVKP